MTEENKTQKKTDESNLLNSVKPFYFDTIKKNGEKKYIEIEVEDYSHIGIIKSNLISALGVINHAADYMAPGTDLTGPMDTIIDILKSIDLCSELEGLDRFLKIK